MVRRIKKMGKLLKSNKFRIILILVISVIAAVVLTYLPEVLRSINNYRMLIYSIVKAL